MKRNEGTADRVIRAFLIAPAAAAVALLVGTTTAWGIVAWVVAGTMLLTATAGFCPIYALLGIDSLPHRDRGEEAGASSLRRAA